MTEALQIALAFVLVRSMYRLGSLVGKHIHKRREENR